MKKLTEYEIKRLNEVEEALKLNLKYLKKNIKISSKELVNGSLKCIKEYTDTGLNIIK